MVAVFDAFGESNRRRILELLAGVELPAGAIVDALNLHSPISQPAVSQHLRTLRDARLVTVRPDGNRRLYAIDQTGINQAQAWLVDVASPMTSFGRSPQQGSRQHHPPRRGQR